MLHGSGRAPERWLFHPTDDHRRRPSQARISQEEIFGPVLAVIQRPKNFDEALEIANNTEFGLTGGVYSKNPAKLEKAQESFHVGNLYLNRKCPAAMVGAHPFGGFNMSGTDSKAGGRDYLLLFLQEKSDRGKKSEHTLGGAAKENCKLIGGANYDGESVKALSFLAHFSARNHGVAEDQHCERQNRRAWRPELARCY